MRIGYVGSTKVTKKILKRSEIRPTTVFSFKKDKKEKISGFAEYEEYGDRWVTVDSINSVKAKNRIRESELDLLLVMGWQELLNKETLSIPNIGCIGRHLSMLPKRRGRAPVAWALIQGLEKTGVTLFWMDEGIDSGDIASQKEVEIDISDEAMDLHRKMTNVSVDMLNELVKNIEDGDEPRRPQNESKATYTHPRRPDMGLINWRESAIRLHNFIRGQTHPYPGAFTYHKMDRVRLWHSNILHKTSIESKPGSVIALDKGSDIIVVQAGEGKLKLEYENEQNKFPLKEGSVLGVNS